MKCCICKKEFHGFKNNPWGAAWKNEKGEVEFLEDFSPTDFCCDECNRNYVIPGRLYRMKLTESKNKQTDESSRNQ